MHNNQIYSTKITQGVRTYFFDISKSEQGTLYLTISESKIIDGKFERYRIFVFKEAAKDFADALNKTLSLFQTLKEPHHLNEKTNAIRKLKDVKKDI